jgi:hypothetical protein
MTGSVESFSGFVDLSVLGWSDEHKIGKIIVEGIPVCVMHVVSRRDRSVMVFPHGNMERDLLSVPVLSPSPVVSPSMLLACFGVSMIHPPIEDDCLR